MVDVDDLAMHRAGFDNRRGQVEWLQTSQLDTERLGGVPPAKISRDRRENIAAVESVADGLAKKGLALEPMHGADAEELCGGREYAVVGTDEEGALGDDQHGLARAADAGVDDREMHAAGGEVRLLRCATPARRDGLPGAAPRASGRAAAPPDRCRARLPS